MKYLKLCLIPCFFLSFSSFAAKGIITNVGSGGGGKAAIVVTPEGNGFGINEQGIGLAISQGLRSSVASSQYSISLNPQSGLTGSAKLKSAEIVLDDESMKLSRDVGGYRLYIAQEGFMVSVSNDNVVSFAINDQGIKFIESSNLRMAITEQGMPKPKKGKEKLQIEVDSLGAFEFSIGE